MANAADGAATINPVVFFDLTLGGKFCLYCNVHEPLHCNLHIHEMITEIHDLTLTSPRLLGQNKNHSKRILSLSFPQT